jgi:hypothetical protein
VGTAVFNNTNDALGQFTIGSLAVAGTLDISGGGTVIASEVTLNGPLNTIGSEPGVMSVSGAGSQLLVTGPFDASAQWYQDLMITNGGLAQITGPSLNDAIVVVDAQSSMEIGDTGSTSSGSVTMDAGDAISLSTDYFLANVTLGAGATITTGGDFVAFGDALVVTTGASINGTGTFVAYNDVVNDGTIAGTTLDFLWDNQSVVQGTGVIEALNGGSIDLENSVAAGSLELKLDNNATLDADAAIAAGNTIALTGTSDVLQLNGFGYNFNLIVGYTPGSLPAPSFIIGDPAGGLVVPLPTVGAEITGFQVGDTIIANASNVTGVRYTPNSDDGSGVLTLLDGITAVGTLNFVGDYSQSEFSVTPYAANPAAGIYDPGAYITLDSPVGGGALCIAAGTRVMTTRGAVAVERLSEGDTVLTISGAEQAIQWIGRRHVHCRRHANRDRVMPVRIAPHAFGAGRPSRAVLLSPDHSVFVENALIPIKYLLNDTTITQIEVDAIDYYHIELLRHDVMFAEGLPVESYLETGGRNAFDNGGGAMQLHPDFTPDGDRVAMQWESLGYAPLLGTGSQLNTVRAKLRLQAALLAANSSLGQKRRLHKIA